MAIENALGFLRAGSAAAEAPIYVIAGPQPFLREYVLDNLRRRMAAQGFQYRPFQAGGGEGFGAVIRELEAADLFAPRRFVACRVLKTYRERGGDDDGDDESTSSGGGGGEAALIGAISKIAPTVRLGLVYERDNAPAKIKRTAEGAGIVINCMRPFDNQIGQYAEVFARGLGLKLARDTADLLAIRHGGDLAAIANALSLAAIAAEAGGRIDEADLGSGGGASRVPDLFELAESVPRGNLNETLALFDRAVQTGRDPIELLAVELIPLIRRMLTAAVLLEKRQGVAAIGRVLALPPSSGLMMRALDGARRFGAERLTVAHRQATTLDASFKAGLLKEREAAIAGLLLELMAPAK
jgi:DNA polymerase III delta subunit